MEKEIKELMETRYIVIADYPGNTQPIGYVFKEVARYFDKFPAVFRKLSWYENRKVEEMPEYLLSSETFPNPHYVKVKNHYASFFEGEYNGKDTFKPYWEAGYTLYFPSTEQECKNHINNQNLK